MDELEKKDRYNKLLFIYGNLLTENRLEKIESYFALDLSLSEIAEEDGVSRNAVHLSIKEAIKELEYYESKLHLLERRERIEKLLEDDKSIDEIKEIILKSENISKTTENTITNPPIESNVLTPLNTALPNKTKNPLSSLYLLFIVFNTFVFNEDFLLLRDSLP